MKRVSVKPSPTEIKSLFALERKILPAPDEVRNRGTERARAALPQNQRAYAAGRSNTTLWRRLGTAAAAAVVLFALCAAAFEVGYRLKNRAPMAPVAKVEAVPMVAEAPAAELPPSEPPAAEPTPALPRQTKAKAAAAKSVSESEAYARELPVLQPALDAVARNDFTAALTAIAAHQSRFPSGQLAEEREALRVKALAGLGRMPEAVRAGATFRQRFPHSALLNQIQEMLGTQR